jgi:hypothetical protein
MEGKLLIAQSVLLALSTGAALWTVVAASGDRKGGSACSSVGSVSKPAG